MNYKENVRWKSNSCMKNNLLAGHVSRVDTTCSPGPASCFSKDLCWVNLSSRWKTLQTCAHFANDREPPLHGRDFKRSLLHFPINNNKLPVSATGKTKSLDLFQRKHDKQAIQRLKRVRKTQKQSRHRSQHLGEVRTIGNPFSICSTRAHGICMFARSWYVFLFQRWCT